MKQPKIRMKGFEGEWKEKRMGEVLIVNSGKDYKHLEDGPIPVYGTGGYMLSVNDSLSSVDAIGIGRKGTIDKPQFLKAPFWTVDTLFFLTTKNGDNLQLLYQLSNKINWKKYDESTGVPSLSKVNIEKINIFLPSLPEQTAIAKYFTALDGLIQATAKELEKLRTMKAASLQSLFPQEGETVPKIRFKGFEGEWKKKPFYETFENLKNNALSRAELSNCGKVRNIHYGDVLIKYGACVNVSKDVDTYVKDNELGLKLHQACPLKSGDVIFADAAEDNTVGKCSEVVAENEEKIVSGLHTIACRPLFIFVPYFLGYYLNSCAYHNQLIPLIQGTKVSSLSKRAFGQTKIVYPSLPEQTAIANYFTALDERIQATAKRLEKLRNIKAACLDNMFV